MFFKRNKTCCREYTNFGASINIHSKHEPDGFEITTVMRWDNRGKNWLIDLFCTIQLSLEQYRRLHFFFSGYKTAALIIQQSYHLNVATKKPFSLIDDWIWSIKGKQQPGPVCARCISPRPASSSRWGTTQRNPGGKQRKWEEKC